MTSENQPAVASRSVVPALALSAPAFAFVFASALYLSPAPSVLMCGLLAAVLVLGVAAAVSYAGLARLYPRTTHASFSAIASFGSKGPCSWRARVSVTTARSASHFCYWIMPGLWITFAAMIAAYFLSQIWWKIPVGSPWVIGFCGVIFAAGLSCLAMRGVRRTVPVIAAISVFQILALLAFGIISVEHRASLQAGTSAWTLDSTGNPTQFVQDTMPDPAQTIEFSDLLSTLLLAAGLAVVLCTSICIMYWFAIRVRPGSQMAGKMIVPAIGWVIGTLAIAFFLGLPWIERGEAALESIGAIVICAAWGLGRMLFRKSASAQMHGGPLGSRERSSDM